MMHVMRVGNSVFMGSRTLLLSLFCHTIDKIVHEFDTLEFWVPQISHESLILLMTNYNCHCYCIQLQAN